MRSERGFSLIEILVALLLLQMALLSLVPMFIYATRSTVSAGDLGSVGVIATRRMELLRETPFLALTAGGNLTADTVGYFSTADPAFIERWRVTDDATPATLKTIEVRVVATRRSIGNPNEITLVNIAAQEPAP